MAKLGEPDSGYKVFCDPVHGHISLHPVLVKIVDTPQFQRLRQIKQLGTNYYVYAGASHNRFEHSIGTAHLAGQLVRTIQKNQSYLGVSDIDVLCVEIAGLCHDLGHGPFSHFFDKVFLKRLSLSYKWTHEDASCKILDYLIKDNKLWPDLKKNRINEDEIEFVKEMIAGPLTKTSDPKAWPYKGRGRDKSFLYEIISNKRNGVDVDKWDYFARDCHHLGIRNTFDHNRFMMFVKVLKVDGPDERLQICVRDKEADNLYGMFQTRSILHRRAYQHKVSKEIDCMLADALVLANPYIHLPGKNGKNKTKRKISECLDVPDAASHDIVRVIDRMDVAAYTELNDGIFDHIAYAKESKLQPARAILRRVLNRNLYKTIGIIKIDPETLSNTKKNGIKKICSKSGKQLKKKDLTLSVKYVDFGKGPENPIDKYMFYSKSDPEKPFHMKKEDVSKMRPVVFEEIEVYFFCKTEDKVDIAKSSFKKWVKELNKSATSSEQSEVDTTTSNSKGPNEVERRRGRKRKSGKKGHQDDRCIAKPKKAKK